MASPSSGGRDWNNRAWSSWGRGLLEGAGLIRTWRVRDLRKGSGILKPEELRLGASTPLKSRNFGPSLQVGEHNLHFVSKVRSWWGGLCLLFPHFKSLPRFPILSVPLHHPPSLSSLPVSAARFSFSPVRTSWATTSPLRMTRPLFPLPSSPNLAGSTAAGEEVGKGRRGREGGGGHLHRST